MEEQFDDFLHLFCLLVNCSHVKQVPPSPIDSEDSEDKFVVVQVEDCQPTGDRDTVYKKLQMDLIRQIQVCVFIKIFNYFLDF